jgi:hypothetical protein
MSRPSERALAAAAAWIDREPLALQDATEQRGARFESYYQRTRVKAEGDPRYQPATAAALEYVLKQRFEPAHPDHYLVISIMAPPHPPCMLVHAPGRLPWKRVLTVVKQLAQAVAGRPVRWHDLLVDGMTESVSERPPAWERLLTAPPRDYAMFEVALDESYQCVKPAQ